jgi:hypothetical protein
MEVARLGLRAVQTFVSPLYWSRLRETSPCPTRCRGLPSVMKGRHIKELPAATMNGGAIGSPIRSRTARSLSSAVDEPSHSQKPHAKV